MNDRRILRRYLALVHHAEELLEASLGDEHSPPTAEAVAAIEELVASLETAASRMPAPAPEPSDIRQQLAGWVH